MDVRHVSLCFASEILEASDEALCLAVIVCVQTDGLTSPLLVADSLRFFRKVCARSLSFSDTQQIFRVTLGLLSRMATDPDVIREGLAVLAEVSNSLNSQLLFAEHFKEVCSNPKMPLALVSGFCRCMRKATNISDLTILARPLQTSVLHQLEAWDPSCLNGEPLQITERRFSALGGLAPLGSEIDRPILEALQARLSGRFPEHLLPCAAPLLASLAKHGGGCALALADRVCVAMANLPPEKELQDHALSLCEALLETGTGTHVSDALAILAGSCTHDRCRRCFELLSKAPLTQSSFDCLAAGLSHQDGRVQLLAAKVLAERPFRGDASEILPRVLQVALHQDGPLLERLADLFMVYTTASALMAAASKIIVGITDHFLKSMVLQSFQKLSVQQGDPKAHFLHFVAEMRALTL